MQSITEPRLTQCSISPENLYNVVIASGNGTLVIEGGSENLGNSILALYGTPGVSRTRKV